MNDTLFDIPEVDSFKGGGFGQGVLFAAKRIINKLFPILNKAGYTVKFRIGNTIFDLKDIRNYKDWTKIRNRLSDNVERLGTGLLLEITKTENPYKKLLFQPWVREDSKNLDIRWHISFENKHLSNERKVKKEIQTLTDNNIYYILVYIDKYKPWLVPRFLVGKYSDIPIKKWRLSYRSKSKVLDRMIFKVNAPMIKLNTETIKEIFDKIFEYESK